MRNVIPFVLPFDQGRYAAQALLDLVQAGAAMTADEAFGMQLALPAGSPSDAFGIVYTTAIVTMEEMVVTIARRRGVPAEAKLDDMLKSMAMDAFDKRWDALNARLGTGGEA